MSELKTYLEQIKSNKDTNVIPENIISGKTILGVPGASKFSVKVESIPVQSNQTALNYFITEINGLNLLDYEGTSLSSFLNGNYPYLTKVSMRTNNRVTNFYNFCYNLTSLEELDMSQMDSSNATSLTNMFYNCYSLSNNSLNSILDFCARAVSYTGTKTLRYLGLSQTQATTCQTLSNWNDFVTAGWSTGY